MPRARSSRTYRQTAAIPQEEGSGCLSGFMLVPLTVLFISAILASLAWTKTTPIPFSSNVTTPDSISTNLSPIFREEVLYWADSISRWASASNLDSNLVATIMQIESCGDPHATSSAGAMGLFQVMPFHFRFGENPYNPETNALRGLNYLSRSLSAANGNARLALAGYNGGIGVITRNEWTWPSETLRYIRFGVPMYEDARSGAPTSTALNDWYQKYGAGLCLQASRRLGLN